MSDDLPWLDAIAVGTTARVTDAGRAGDILLTQDAFDALGPPLHDRLIFAKRTIPTLKDFEDDTVYALRLLPECHADRVGTDAADV